MAKPAGEPFSLEEIGKALETHKPVLFFVTHGESSTGGLQGLEGIGPLCARYVCLLVTLDPFLGVKESEHPIS